MLYVQLKGTKQRVSYETLSKLWVVTTGTARNILIIFEQYKLIKKTQETDCGSTNNNRGYLFVTPLIHFLIIE